MCLALCLAVLLGADPARPSTSAKSPAEYGHGLSAQEAHDGWLSLYDGATDFGWKDAKIVDGVLTGGETTTPFGPIALRAEIVEPGDLLVGGRTIHAAAGRFETVVRDAGRATIRLGPGVQVKSLCVQPLDLRSVFNSRDLTGWSEITHPQIPAERQTKWSVSDGAIHARGGPGALELVGGSYGDLILQVEGRTRQNLVNGGVFFRAISGDFMNGYEAQIFHACYDQDPAQPARYSTGAIDDRQLARRLVSRDREPFTMTVIAAGPHLATWVNGYQTIDLIDTRPEHENPRLGLRVKPGAIQLQSHDPETDLEFRAVRIVELP